MKFIKIDKQEWQKGLDKLRAAYRLVGPVKKNNGVHEFEPLEKGQLPDLDMINTRMSAKALVYPQGEKMFEYTLDEKQPDHHILKEAPKDYNPRAVIGIRPCDADAFLIAKRNFDSQDYRDPYWVRAYEAITLVGYACDSPCSSCFCSSTASGPYSESGLDVLLVDENDHYLAKSITTKGAALLSAAGWARVTDVDAAVKSIEERRDAAEKKIASAVTTDQLAAKETTELFDAPFWEDVAFACINCGTCTFLCPTCWCFDIQDEVHGKNGARIRNWDTCMAPLFTRHGSGHDPRGIKMQRVRQRFMHKLKYYVDKYDKGIQCVGCGRCVSACPVNIDIRNVCELMNNY